MSMSLPRVTITVTAHYHSHCVYLVLVILRLGISNHVTLLLYRSWPHLLFTIALVHQCQVLLKLPRHAVYRFKASNLPFTLATDPSSQFLSWSYPPSQMTQCVSYATSFFITCLSLSTFPPLWHVLLTQVYLWTDHMCNSLNTGCCFAILFLCFREVGLVHMLFSSLFY
jgi:hypothetical protein